MRTVSAPATEHDAASRSEDGRAMVRVPDLVGVPAAEAHDRALDAGVLAVAANAVHTGAGRAWIGSEDPGPGTELETGAIVRIWIGADPAAGATT